MMPLHILTDADGVLVDWNHGFLQFLAAKGYNVSVVDEESYSFVDRLGLTKSEEIRLIEEFNYSDGIRYLEPFADAVENVAKLADAGFRFTVITSLGNTPEAINNRTHNLRFIFGDIFDDIQCLKMGLNKSIALNKWVGSNLLWVDDHITQVEAGYNQGLSAILVTHPYNKVYTEGKFRRVSHTTPWAEIYNIAMAHYYQF